MNHHKHYRSNPIGWVISLTLFLLNLQGTLPHASAFETELLSLGERAFLNGELSTAADLLEKAALADATQIKEQLDQARIAVEKAMREGRYEKAGELHYDLIPRLEAKLAKAEALGVTILNEEQFIALLGSDEKRNDQKAGQMGFLF